ncbi:hypothetical protein [Litorimonas sp. WD9-15]|uniref:hypothetical protein n=1 Tax=Litorimonas sp. WD9-15 TaxID=3418716 RepID=UPI003D0058D7
MLKLSKNYKRWGLALGLPATAFLLVACDDDRLESFASLSVAPISQTEAVYPLDLTRESYEVHNISADVLKMAYPEAMAERQDVISKSHRQVQFFGASDQNEEDLPLEMTPDNMAYVTALSVGFPELITLRNLASIAEDFDQLPPAEFYPDLDEAMELSRQSHCYDFDGKALAFANLFANLYLMTVTTDGCAKAGTAQSHNAYFVELKNDALYSYSKKDGTDIPTFTAWKTATQPNTALTNPDVYADYFRAHADDFERTDIPVYWNGEVSEPMTVAHGFISKLQSAKTTDTYSLESLIK